jgi:hypothetical protein
MADILTFYGFRKRVAAADDSEKLQYAAEPRDATPGHTPNGREAHLAVSQADRTCDWTNQELADLYRVEALLAQANVRIETTRGTSDEGDPWFVFCRADGEVFVHLARIDGLYVLDSPKLDVVLSGPSFAALIDRFANAVVLCAPTGNIVQLRPFSRNSVVRIHPAAMLAALVWSLYLACDNMVGNAQAGEPAADAGHLTPISGLDGDAGADKAPTKLEADRKLAAVDNHAPVANQADHHFRALAASEGFSCSVTNAAAGIAIGLTTIAISFGLFDRDFEATHNAAKLEVSDVLQSTPDLVHASLLPLSFTQIDKSMSEVKEATATESAATATNPTGLALNTVEHMREVAVQIDPEIPIDKVTQSAAEKASWSLAVEKGVTSPFTQLFASQASDLTETASSGAKDLQGLITLATEHLGQLSSYDIVGLKVDATFDVSTLSKQVADFVLADLTGGPESAEKPLDNTPNIDTDAQLPDNVPHADVIAQYLPYDDAAKSFVYQFLLKSDTIEAIRSGNSVVLFDTTVTDDPNDHAYSVSWVMDDHTIVSTIGHAQDFAGFLLA